MAGKYGKYPNVIYEIFNEPDYYSWEDIKTYSEELITTIRAIDPDNIILVGSPHWDQDLHLVAENPIKGQNNIMYTMHFYAGTHKKWLRDRTDEAIATGIPVFVSECAGMEASGDGPIDDEEWNSFLNWMEAKKSAGLSGRFPIKMRHVPCSFPVSSEGNWADDVIKKAGSLGRDAIRKGNLNNVSNYLNHDPQLK